jgi:conjugal transfer pilin signal peptidase TrbI
VPRGCYFVTTGHKDGFDSRYAAIGWICRQRILGVGRPIL